MWPTRPDSTPHKSYTYRGNVSLPTRIKNKMTKFPSISARQQASLQSLAARAGLAPEVLERRILSNLQGTYREAATATARMKESLGAPWGSEHTASVASVRAAHILENTSDLWEYLNASEEVTNWATRWYVARDAPALHLNWRYLQSMARQFSLPEPVKDSEGFEAFLKTIPTTYLFDHEFNAFLDWTDDECPPTIYCNLLLTGAITELSKIVGLHYMASVIPEAYPRDLPFPDKSVFDSEVARLFSFVLDGQMFSQRHLPDISTLEPKTFVSVVAHQICALNFVAFHEFGHLLLGHVERAHSPALEHEADVFALQLIGRSGFPLREHAIVSVIAIIKVLEIAFGLSASHPPSLKRVTLLANAEGLGLDFKRFEQAANFYNELFDRSLKDRFGRGLFEDSGSHV